jgi:hypothetical protein
VSARQLSINVDGLAEFQAALREMDRDLPKQIRLVLNDAVGLVIDYTRPRVPKVTGRAANSIKAKSSQREARVSVGGRGAPYYPWLDFGGQGRVRGRPAPRTFIRKGRYLYPGLDAKRDEVTEAMEAGLTALAAGAGLDSD